MAPVGSGRGERAAAGGGAPKLEYSTDADTQTERQSWILVGSDERHGDPPVLCA
jgi:hypothetical protein